MATTVVTSKIFENMFGTAKMRALFTDEALVQRYLDVEAALAKVQARLGIIPQEAADQIMAKSKRAIVDFDKLKARTEIVGYPILPLVEQLVAACTDGLGEYCHWGATTQDIMDTADAMQVKDALVLLGRDLDAVATRLAALAREHRDTPMAGRTHLQHALPVTFGYKCAVWLSSVDRHRARLAELMPRATVGEFGGAAGTLASLGADGLAVQDALMDELGLGRPDITWHTARDSFAEASGLLALISGTLGKIGYDVILTMQTEVGEVFEPFVPGRGASSTMPQKRNPIASELLLAAAKVVRQHHGSMLDALVQDHERATGPWQVEWHALPEAFILTAGALHHTRELLDGLEIDTAAMRRNLDATGGLIVAEAVMMGLARHIGRQRAHDVVYDCCRAALEDDVDFLEALVAHEEIDAALPRETLAELVEPSNYLGTAPLMIDRLLAERG